jgi:pimeloyl-ACP methyl ester carboxylesterase
MQKHGTGSILLADRSKEARMSSRQDGRTASRDGVEIAYSEAGNGPVSLLLIHGGLASRAFWTPQLAALGDSFRMAALDLAGHGESGRNREQWTIPAFAGDVCAVAEALDLGNVVLVGNSLGGPVALEAAALLAGHAIGVIGVDTLHVVETAFPPEEARARGAAYRTDFPGSCASMVYALFHPGEHMDLQAWALKIMLAMDKEVAARMMEGLAGYDLGAAFRRAGVPIRAINGDLWPTEIEANRKLAPDFDAVIMPGAGHYPMLERPDEFNRILVQVVDTLVG